MGEIESEERPAKKAKIFCPRTFRQELRGNEVLKSLKSFVSAAKNSDEVVYEYLDSGGSVQEILSLLDVTAKGDLTTALPVFEVVHLILLRFQTLDSRYHQRCLDGARTILNSHLPTIKSMLSMNITKQKKVALKLLTAMVTLHSSFAIEIMNVMALSPTLIADLIQLTPDKESVRKYFILFILSFLVDGNVTVVKNLLDKKGFLSSIIPGLKFDDSATVNLILSLFGEKILNNIKIPKTLKLKLFNTQTIKSLFDLYDWKGPQSTKQLLPKKKNKVKEVEVNQKEKELVVESVHSFLLLLCCSKKFGVAFSDKSMGTSDQLSNQLLLTAFESLPDPLKNKKIAEVLLKTIASCPDIMKPILLKLEPSFQPRNSKNWFQAMDFAENLILAMDPVTTLKNDAGPPTANQIIRVGKTLCTPPVFLKIAKLGAQKSQPMEIRLCSLRLLSTMWTETQKLAAAFQKFESDLKKSMNHHVSKFLPDAGDLVELWHTLCSPEALNSLSFSVDKRSSFLSAVLKSLHIIMECQRDAVSSPLNLASDLLQHVESVKETMNRQELDDIQLKIVQLVETDLQALTPNMELFEKFLLILLGSTEESSITYASKILANLEIFQSSRAEVEVWILSYFSLPEEYRLLAADYLIESIRQFFKGKITEEEAEVEESLTGLIFEAVKTLKRHSKEENAAAFSHYINDVIVHLQHFYTTNVFLYDLLKDFKKILSKSAMNYLMSWKNNALEEIDPRVFSCPQELDLVSWLVSEGDTRNAGEVIKRTNTNFLKLYSLFRTGLAYLILKIVNESLGEKDAEKLTDLFLIFLRTEAVEDDRETVELISFDLKNEAVFKRNCLNCLFLNERLLNAFDVFNKKEKADLHATAIVVEVLIRSGIVKESGVKKRLSEPWKQRFLKQLKRKLKKGKHIEGLDNLERVVDFFEYEESDVFEMVELLMGVSGFDLFENGKNLSAWVVILSKFIRLHCRIQELCNGTITNLCSIMKYLSQRCFDLNVMDDCFVFLLRSHPRHLLLMEDDFLNVILRRTISTPATIILGKLLLNDPSKVKLFLKLVSEDLTNLGDPQLVLSMLSVLIIKEDSFLATIESEGVWTSSTIEKSLEIFKALRVVYEKFQENILRAMSGQEEEIVLKNVDFIRELVKLFIDKKSMKQLKKEMVNGKFHPELVFKAVRKVNVGTITDSYVHGLLILFCRLLRNSKEERNWEKFCSIVSDVIDLKKDSSWEEVVESSEWKEFAKLAMGHCLASTDHPSLLKTLRLLITAAAEGKPKDSALFFQMLISHSHFLKVMLSGSPLKGELVELFHCLIERTPSEMSSKHVPILLAAYTARLSPCDETLLRVLRLYEKSGINVSDYEPFVWGEAAISHYSIGTNSGLSLWQRFNMANVLELLEEQRMRESLTWFPLRRSLEVNEMVDCNPNVYDPAFLLPLFVNLLSPGSVVFCLPFIYRGGLGYAFRALSSECEDVRIAASVVLTRFYSHLELSQKMKQKLVWMHFINCFRYGIEDLSSQPLPNVASLFFARMTLELSSSPAEMYLPLQNFLLAKTYFVLDTVPEFLPLFHSSQVSFGRHRQWLLEVLRDGTRSTLDLNAIFHSMAIKVIFCFFHSQLCDNETKKLILQVMESLLKVKKSVLLISEYGLLNWINSIDSGSFQTILPDLLKLLSASASAITEDIKVHKAKNTNSSHLIQIINIAVKLLPSVRSLKSVEVFNDYLKLVFKCLIPFLEERKSDWFTLNRSIMMDLIEAGKLILGENHDCGKVTKVMFYFRDYGEESSDSEVDLVLKNAVFVFNRLIHKANDSNINE